MEAGSAHSKASARSCLFPTACGIKVNRPWLSGSSPFCPQSTLHSFLGYAVVPIMCQGLSGCYMLNQAGTALVLKDLGTNQMCSWGMI